MNWIVPGSGSHTFQIISYYVAGFLSTFTTGAGSLMFHFQSLFSSACIPSPLFGSQEAAPSGEASINIDDFPKEITFPYRYNPNTAV